MAQDSVTGNPSGGTGGSGGDPAASMRQATDEIHRGLHALQEAQRTARRQTLLMVLVVVILTLIFIFGTYKKLEDNFRADKIRAAANARLPGVQAEFKRRFSDVGVAVAPTYQAAAEKKFEQIRPNLEKNFVAAAEGLRDEVAEASKAKLQARMNAMLKRLEPDLKQAFPNLPEAQKVHLVEKFESKAHAQTDLLIDDLVKMYVKETNRLESALDGFDIVKASKQDKADLSWNFMHLLVKIVEHKMAESASPKKDAPAMPTAINE